MRLILCCAPGRRVISITPTSGFRGTWSCESYRAGAVLPPRVPKVLAATYDLIIKGGRVIDPSVELESERQSRVSGPILSTDWNVTSKTTGIVDFPNVMSKFLMLGMPLKQIIACATFNAARVFRLSRTGARSTWAHRLTWRSWSCGKERSRLSTTTRVRARAASGCSQPGSSSGAGSCSALRSRR